MNLIHNSVHVCARRGSGLAGRPACRRHALWYAIFRIRMPEIAVFQCAEFDYCALSFATSAKSCVHRAPSYWRSFEAQRVKCSMRAHSKGWFISIFRGSRA